MNHMSKAEFMRQLESLLQNISEQERQEALQYYDDYFNDAGPENEQSVIEALGNPARVAENIRRDLYGAGYGDGYEARKAVTGRELAEYGEATKDPQKQEQAQPGETQWQSGGAQWDENGSSPNQGAGMQGTSGEPGRKGMSGGMIALIVILCICASPAVFGLIGGAVGLVGGILGVVVGVFVGWFALIFGFGVAAVACLVVGVVIMILGAIGMGIHPLAGIGILGGGLITAGIGILFMMLTVAMAGGATPAIFRGIRRLFSRKKKTA